MRLLLALTWCLFAAFTLAFFSATTAAPDLAEFLVLGQIISTAAIMVIKRIGRSHP